jgi:alginate O-acetyltransferase complex protein AlgI
MLFNSPEFLFLFLPIVLLVFIYLARFGDNRAQIIWLVIASIVFYGSWNPMFVLLIMSSVMVNYFLGRALAGAKEHLRKILVLGVLFNLCLLGYFKYVGFFVDNLSALGIWLIPLPNIVLPLAISFFTFQQIAYLIDVSRGECKEYGFLQYTLFVVFFPQLIAGPIVHHAEMMPQFEKLRNVERLWPDIAVGFTLITIGLFKKVVLADSLAQYADPLFDVAAGGARLSTLDAWIATFSFSFQIYFDFSGYTDMAIGSARLFGIRLPENFSAPYKSLSIIEFWRRWHMTLSRFLRDYLYFSLGGNRHGTARRYRNLLLTMLLGGLWHGAAWTFVVWGGLHGFYLCINHGWRALCRAFGLERLRTGNLLKPLYISLTALAWSLAFVVFRAADLGSAKTIVFSGFTRFSESLPDHLGAAASVSFMGRLFADMDFGASSYAPVYTLLGACAFIVWFMPTTQQYTSRYNPVIGEDSEQTSGLFAMQWQPGWLSLVIVVFMLIASLLNISNVSQFIYFQF